MKTFTLIGGIIIFCLSIMALTIAYLFKVMHWPGVKFELGVAAVLAIIGITLITIHIIKYRIK